MTDSHQKGKKAHHFDAIVVGSGISGGWAAKELTEKGLKTLVLERGPDVQHIADYTTAFKNPWDFEHGLELTRLQKQEQYVQSNCHAVNEGNRHFFVNDQDYPYQQEKPFNWFRGYQVGGRSLTWGRQCYRWSDLDFNANLKDGVAVDWPIRYKDIEPWYTYVERFVGISGRKRNLPQLPDSEFLPPIEMNCLEQHFSNELNKAFPERHAIEARMANLTAHHQGRGPCQYRNLCNRGCPYTGYFSSNGATLPAAQKTGNLTLLSNKTVAEVLYDKEKGRAKGLRVIDTETLKVTEYFAKIIFLNASTIATAALLLNSKSEAFPTGLGNSSDQVGRNLMDHFLMVGAKGEFEGFEDKYYHGRTPGNLFIPKFRNINDATSTKDFIRGYGIQGKGSRMEWQDMINAKGFGKSFKEKLLKPGNWKIFLAGYGETLPYETNRVTLAEDKTNRLGLAQPKIHFEYHENEKTMRADIKQTTYEMLERTGFKNIQSFDYDQPPGSAIHEMGTARMGKDPKTSVLNGFNQMHDVQNVFITDGSCMTSSGWQNPSLTYMALTARACDYAAKELKKGNL